MEKVTQQTIAETITVHDFYCDECGAHFGTAREHDDGSYHALGKIYFSLYAPDGWHEMQKCLCDNCRTKVLPEIDATLKAIGFSKVL